MHMRFYKPQTRCSDLPKSESEALLNQAKLKSMELVWRHKRSCPKTGKEETYKWKRRSNKRKWKMGTAPHPQNDATSKNICMYVNIQMPAIYRENIVLAYIGNKLSQKHEPPHLLECIIIVIRKGLTSGSSKLILVPVEITNN